jgi:hypothetical protein
VSGWKWKALVPAVCRAGFTLNHFPRRVMYTLIFLGKWRRNGNVNINFRQFESTDIIYDYFRSQPPAAAATHSVSNS